MYHLTLNTFVQDQPIHLDLQIFQHIIWIRLLPKMCRLIQIFQNYLQLIRKSMEKISFCLEKASDIWEGVEVFIYFFWMILELQRVSTLIKLLQKRAVWPGSALFVGVVCRTHPVWNFRTSILVTVQMTPHVYKSFWKTAFKSQTYPVGICFWSF